MQAPPESFGLRVAEAARTYGPLCAGIDPSGDLLHAWGLSDDAAGLRTFCDLSLEALSGAVAILKPQVAFFERHGSAGLAELERLVALAHQAHVMVLNDAKRGDIDSTAAAYADAWLGSQSPLAADAVTVHPYLGLAALAPMLELAGQHGRGVVVVVRSSNPQGRPLQQAVTSHGLSVEDLLLTEIAAWNTSDQVPVGTVGAVIGATLEPTSFLLAQLGGVILAPGLGAQGASPEDVAARFSGLALGSVLVSTSRALLSEGPDPKHLRQAALELNENLAGLMG